MNKGCVILPGVNLSKHLFFLDRIYKADQIGDSTLVYQGEAESSLGELSQRLGWLEINCITKTSILALINCNDICICIPLYYPVIPSSCRHLHSTIGLCIYNFEEESWESCNFLFCKFHNHWIYEPPSRTEWFKSV